MKRSSGDSIQIVKARTEDGKLITLKSTGKSKAQMIRESQEKERSKESKRKNRRNRRKGNGS
jgi:hypothetical protein